MGDKEVCGRPLPESILKVLCRLKRFFKKHTRGNVRMVGRSLRACGYVRICGHERVPTSGYFHMLFYFIHSQLNFSGFNRYVKSFASIPTSGDLVACFLNRLLFSFQSHL